MIAGRYTLVREIGRGGMGAVWLGRDEVLGRDVAVKRIGMHPGGQTADLERAEREAKLAARLNHPHVVAVFDLVVEDDAQWLVMEHVEGLNLAELVTRDGPLTVDQAAQVIQQAAEALAQAHAAGIVHRDVKPSNILVTPTGQVKLTDFGIARAEADASLTQTGLVTGSPAYLAPEVASGRMATDASDVWSLGATLYHALEGRPPYDVGDNLMGAMYRIVHEEPPRPTHAGWLDPLLLATMAKEPSDRWSMLQVQQYATRGPQGGFPAPLPAESEATRAMTAPPTSDHTSVLASVPPPVPAGRSRRRRRQSAALVPVLVIACLLVLAVIAGALVLNNQRDDTTAATDPTVGQSTTPSPSPSPSPSEPSASESADSGARAEAMTAFVTDYLNTVVSDPATAWDQLTPAFKKESGGFGKYRQFWDPFDSAEILDIGSDGDTGIVSYSVRYTNADGGGFADTVQLQLEEAGDSFLIAGEA